MVIVQSLSSLLHSELIWWSHAGPQYQETNQNSPNHSEIGENTDLNRSRVELRINTICAQFLFYYLVVHLPLQPCDLFSTFVRKLQVSRLGTGDWMDSHCVFVVFNTSCPHIQTPEYHWNYQGGNNRYLYLLFNCQTWSFVRNSGISWGRLECVNGFYFHMNSVSFVVWAGGIYDIIIHKYM